MKVESRVFKLCLKCGTSSEPKVWKTFLLCGECGEVLEKIKRQKYSSSVSKPKKEASRGDK